MKRISSPGRTRQGLVAAHRPVTPVLVGLSLLAVPTLAAATNGMFMIGYGSKAQAVGGAAIGYAQDALAGATNPAAISRVTNRWDAGLDILNSRASATIGLGTADPLSQDSKAELFPIPHFAWVGEKEGAFTFGISAVGAGGGASEYSKNLYNHSAGANVDERLAINLSIMQINPTLAWDMNETNTFGASLVVGIQQFEAQGLGFFSRFGPVEGEDPRYLTNNRQDYAFGVGMRFGWMGSFLHDQMTVGISATTPVYMQPFNQYKDLFAEQGRLNTPANVGVGMSLQPTQNLTFALDVNRVFYSDVNAIGNPGPPPDGSLFPDSREENALGKDNGLGFGWEDQTVYKIGVAYNWDEKITVRTGWNYGESPIPEGSGAVLFNILAPATVQNHFTAGLTYAPTDASEWSFAYVHAFRHAQRGPTNIGNEAEIEMEQDLIGLTYGRKF